ncbi:Glycosyl hydrolase family 100 - like 1 [Theobroma cacao]|nr:Glycosyl hydrolase family 100 - like 1 [Theobroma cacao]
MNGKMSLDLIRRTHHGVTIMLDHGQPVSRLEDLKIAKRAIELAEHRLPKDEWPEYHDGKSGSYVGKQARKYQTWSVSSYLVAKMMIEILVKLAKKYLQKDDIKACASGESNPGQYRGRVLLPLH